MRGLAALLLALTVPLAGADWKGPGSYEPSTREDRTHPSMFTQPDRSFGQAAGIYLNGFVNVGGLTLNPNVGAVEGRFLPPGPTHHRAMLGAWKDCNNDGYIGHAESALQDYSALLLLGDPLCPAGSLFNDGTWVSEMLGIGIVDPCEFVQSQEIRDRDCGGLAPFHRNERVIYANHTKVWADIGRPGTLPGAECPTAPPPGTTSGTGLLLAYGDCQIDRRVAKTVNTIDPNGAHGLRFEDPERPDRSTSALNVPFPVNLFGGPQGPGILQGGTGEPSTRVWDCREPRAFEVPDLLGVGRLGVEDPSGGKLSGPQAPIPVAGRVTIFHREPGSEGPGVFRLDVADDEGDLAHAPAVAPPQGVNPTASWWDTLEHVHDGPGGDCDPATKSGIHAARPGPIVEGGEPQVDEAHRNRNSLTFTFYDGHRGLNENIDFLTGELTPSDGGLLFHRHDRGGSGPMWSADAPTVQEPQLITRGSLEPTGALYWTYYAHVGPEAFAMDFRLASGGTAFVYGIEACTGHTNGIRNGWECDPAAWWRDALGNDVTPRYRLGQSYAAVPGEIYHLRDVDCYDGHLGAGAAWLSLTLLSPSVC